jgi:hypothetical protein
MMAHGCGGTGEDRGEGWRRARRSPTGAVVVTVRGEMGRVEANGRAVRGRGSSGGARGEGVVTTRVWGGQVNSRWLDERMRQD